MKKQTRIQKHGSPRAAVSQAKNRKNRNGNASEPPPWFYEVIHRATDRPTLSEVILGPSLYAKAQAISRKGCMTTSDLVLAVLCCDLFECEECRSVLRSGKWFLAGARRIVKLARRTS